MASLCKLPMSPDNHWPALSVTVPFPISRVQREFSQEIEPFDFHG